MTEHPPAGGKPASPFWTFSLRLYGKPGVPPACLALQAGSGVDVNVLLFCLFAAKSGRALALPDVTRILATTEPWKSGAVVALRAARVYLRDPAPFIDAAAAEALRQRIKADELEAERLQQEGLFAAFPMQNLGAPANAHAAARQNVHALQSALAAKFDAAALDAILAAFDQLGDQPS
jgi:uncharacterized protein (TIGR02444 family)